MLAVTAFDLLISYVACSILTPTQSFMLVAESEEMKWQKYVLSSVGILIIFLVVMT